MDPLPTELLLQILSHLDVPPPSVANFSHEPSPSLPNAPLPLSYPPLKALSLTSHRLHTLTQPLLFRHCVLRLDPTPTWLPVDARTLDGMQAALETLSPHEHDIYTRMRSKLASTQPGAFGAEFDELMVEFIWIRPGDNWFTESGDAVWVPSLPASFSTFCKFMFKKERIGPGFGKAEGKALKERVESVVVVAEQEYNGGLRHEGIRNADAALYHAVSELWERVFDLLDPERIVVVAPPSTLAALTETSTLTADGWAFEMGCHYLELRQPIRSHKPGARCGSDLDLEHETDCTRASDDSARNALIHARPWTHVSYNEGSSVPAYSTYEYHLKLSPKILYLLLARLAKEAKPCCGLRSLTFIAVFPLAESVKTTLQALRKIRTLQRLEMQLAPGSENDVLDNAARLGRAQRQDLWMEWDGCYRQLLQFSRQREHLCGVEPEFCSGDGANGYGGEVFRREMALPMLRVEVDAEVVLVWVEVERGKWRMGAKETDVWLRERERQGAGWEDSLLVVQRFV